VKEPLGVPLVGSLWETPPCKGLIVSGELEWKGYTGSARVQCQQQWRTLLRSLRKAAPEGSGSSGMEDCFVLAQPVPPGGLQAGGNENLDRAPPPSAAREVIMFECKHSQATSGVALAERASSDATTSTRQPTRAEPVFGSTNVNACFSLTYRPAERIITVHRQTRQQTQRTKQR